MLSDNFPLNNGQALREIVQWLRVYTILAQEFCSWHLWLEAHNDLYARYWGSTAQLPQVLALMCTYLKSHIHNIYWKVKLLLKVIHTQPIDSALVCLTEEECRSQLLKIPSPSDTPEPKLTWMLSPWRQAFIVLIHIRLQPTRDLRHAQQQGNHAW